MSTRPKGLGRGLAALLGNDEPVTKPSQLAVPAQRTMPLTSLSAGKYQPRTRMDESALQELAQSLSQYGLMQPILIRPLRRDSDRHQAGGAAGTQPKDQRYEIIAGERRFRAAQLAGLTEVPVIVRDVSDEQALALALIENIQREDLNPLEEARAIKRLLDEFGYTHEQASHAIGRSRSATSNLLRLLNLADSVQTMLLAGDIDMGHARALLPLERAQQAMLAQRIVQKQMNVRDAERMVTKELSAGDEVDGQGRRHKKPQSDRDLLALQEKLCDALATEVKLIPGPKGRGKIVITYSSLENFEGLLTRLGLPSTGPNTND